MDYKLPYYMAYPTPLEYDDERKERQDMEYMKSLYPDTVKQILPFVEDECERMEYEGSMIYDEYPDRLSLRLMCGRICDRIERMGLTNNRNMQIEMEMQQRGGNQNDVRNIVEVLLLHEILRRRNENRRKRRRYYPGF